MPSIFSDYSNSVSVQKYSPTLAVFEAGNEAEKYATPLKRIT